MNRDFQQWQLDILKAYIFWHRPDREPQLQLLESGKEYMTVQEKQAIAYELVEI